MTTTLLSQRIDRARPTADEHQRFLVQCMYRLIKAEVIELELLSGYAGKRLVLKLKSKEKPDG